MRYVIFICFSLLSLKASSANGDPPLIESRLRDYYSAMAKKELDLSTSFFHPESQMVGHVKAEFTEFWKQFDLSYQISEVKEIGRADGDIVVSYVEETTFYVVGGEKINTFRAKVLMVWRKDKSGAYKIWDSLPLLPAKAENTQKTKG